MLTQSVYPRREHVWVDGGSVDFEDDLWQQVVDQLGLLTDVSDTTGKSTDSGTSREWSGELTLPGFAKGRAGVTKSRGRGGNSGTTASGTLSPKARALQGMAGTQRALIIDDFHYLDRDIQGSVVRALKALVFDGHPVVLIAIPHRRYDAVRVE